MLGLIVKRLLAAIPILFLVATAAFFLMRAAPGNPFDTGRKLPIEVERQIMARYGMDRPLAEQYVRYMGGLVRGDFGPSLKYRDKSVAQMIAEGLPRSATLGLSALTLALLVGGPLGIWAALRHNRGADRAATLATTLGLCIPTFVTAPLLVLLFGSTLGWLPVAGWGGIRNLILPVTVLALPQIAIIARLIRAGMIEALAMPHVRTARAKGLPPARIVVRHALPGAALPLVAYLGPAAAGLLTGSLVVEQIFNLPGLGRYFVISALQRDYTVVMGVVILYAALILALNLVADLIQAALDPRQRLAR